MPQILVKNSFMKNLLEVYLCKESSLINCLVKHIKPMINSVSRTFCLKYLKKELNLIQVVHAVLCFVSRILGFACVFICEPFLCLIDTSLGLCYLSCIFCDPLLSFEVRSKDLLVVVTL